jgi:uncharacterized membrane protein HdeD (DUF308 family)
MPLMVILGVILLIVGIVLLLAPVPLANADTVGWILVLFGIILVLVGLLLGSDIDISGDEASNRRSSWGGAFGPLGVLWLKWHNWTTRKRVIVPPGQRR